MLAVLRSPAEIVFGPGQRRSLGRVVASLGGRALVLADPFVAASDHGAEMQDCLRAAGVQVELYSEVVPELPLASVDEAVSRADVARADVVVAIGGGSCIDLAKVVAAVLAHGVSASELYGEFVVPGPTLPVVAVPTTAGTGSEVTPVAVLTDPSLTSKVGISSPHLIPTTALCDPELTLSCPPGLTAAVGADALTHAVEALTAVRRSGVPGISLDRVFIGSGALTDLLAREAVGHLVAGLPQAVAHGDDLEARSQVMYGSLLAGLAFGTAGTSAAHALQYPVGALTQTPHGVGVGLLLPYVMQLNLPARPAEMALVAAALAGPGERPSADRAPAMVQTFLRDIGLPTRLPDIGFPENRIAWAAARGVEAKRLSQNNPVALTAETAEHVLRAAWAGELSEAAPAAMVGEVS
ncbi:iron-containing alcohol dehydrogenase [Desertihabitans brevis]|uniref:Iron-containing alcohol dehydrogenase n=1 Tax=Desertihabitans brevis TaxID=2268447 RepID=A0A367YSU6_9ACTN|nr:iron-containing alcohol dehydrogenase [Desertihabitans brevis]RCK68953.1 iron-containing alcohol dehydrogenase [Desertihabitans brevis]